MIKLISYQDYLKTFAEKFNVTDISQLPDILNFVPVGDAYRDRFRVREHFGDFLARVIRDRNLTQEQTGEYFEDILNDYRAECLIFPTDKEPDHNLHIYHSEGLDKEFKLFGVIEDPDNVTPSHLAQMRKDKGIGVPEFELLMNDMYIPLMTRKKQPE